MQTIGERLEEARKRKAVSIREAAETTKIRGDYLQKFEANTFDIALPPLYIRGFLRAYARFLELDPERIVSDFNTVFAKEGRAPRRETREGFGRVDFGDPARKSDSGSPAPAADRSAQDQAVMLKFAFLGGGVLVAIVVVILLIKVLFTSTPARPVAQTAPPPATAPANAAQTLTLTAVEATRVKIVHEGDGKVLFNAALARGESKSLSMEGPLLVTVEAGKNLRVEVNGKNLPVPIDGYGQFRLE